MGEGKERKVRREKRKGRREGKKGKLNNLKPKNLIQKL
jgi:hypothetical protein